MRNKVIAGIFVLIVMSALLGILSAKNAYAEEILDKELLASLKTFTEVLSILRKHYIDDIKIKDFIYGAINGGLHTLDSGSAFLPPEAYKEFSAKTKEKSANIGINITRKKGVITVIAPIEDGPAYNAGIRSGDEIIKVNSESTEYLSIGEVINRLRGAPKTDVTISILRKGLSGPKDFTITRDIVNTTSVQSKILDRNIGYIRISLFEEQTSSELSNTIENLTQAKITSLILDLRDNPGGLLNSAVEVAEQFLPPNRLVVYTKNKWGKKAEFYTKKERGYNVDIPVVVLVNQGSAGSSEIVAGALKDWNRGIILGTQTFGRSTIQTIIPLSDGSTLKVTTERYFTPKDVLIESLGITPHIIEEIEDAQLKGAIDIAVLIEEIGIKEAIGKPLR